MKLWSYWRSSCSYRVRIALGLKGLSYEYVAVHLIREGGEQHRAEFGALNPQRQVPVLEAEEAAETVRLVQSMAIIQYLDERYPDPPLLPAALAERAHVRALAEVVNTGIQPLQNIGTFVELRKGGIDTDTWSRHFIAQGLTALEQLAKPRAGEFLFGDRISLADVFLVPQLYNARRWGVALEAFPTLTRADQNAQALPAVRAAAPDQQPDAEA